MPTHAFHNTITMAASTSQCNLSERSSALCSDEGHIASYSTTRTKLYKLTVVICRSHVKKSKTFTSFGCLYDCHSKADQHNIDGTKKAMHSAWNKIYVTYALTPSLLCTLDTMYLLLFFLTRELGHFPHQGFPH